MPHVPAPAWYTKSTKCTMFTRSTTFMLLYLAGKTSQRKRNMSYSRTLRREQILHHLQEPCGKQATGRHDVKGLRNKGRKKSQAGKHTC